MRKFRLSCLASLLITFASVTYAASGLEPVDYVKPGIGGVSILLTTTRPVVQLPHDYPQVTPLLNPGITDSYLATKIYGFPAGGVALMPATGGIQTDPERMASSFDRDFETRTPYYYEGLLEDSNIQAFYTVGHFAIFYRLRFPSATNQQINIMMESPGWMQAVSPVRVEGSTSLLEVPYYFVLEFSKPSDEEASWQGRKSVSRCILPGREMIGCR